MPRIGFSSIDAVRQRIVALVRHGEAPAPHPLQRLLDHPSKRQVLQKILELIPNDPRLQTHAQIVDWLIWLNRKGCVSIKEVKSDEAPLIWRSRDVAEDPYFYVLFQGDVGIITRRAKKDQGPDVGTGKHHFSRTGVRVVGEDVAYAGFDKEKKVLNKRSSRRIATVVPRGSVDHPSLFLRFDYQEMVKLFGTSERFQKLKKGLKAIHYTRTAGGPYWSHEVTAPVSFDQVVDGSAHLAREAEETSRMMLYQSGTTLVLLGAKTAILDAVITGAAAPEVGVHVAMNIGLTAGILWLIAKAVHVGHDLRKHYGLRLPRLQANAPFAIHLPFMALAQTLATVKAMATPSYIIDSWSDLWHTMREPLEAFFTLHPPFFVEAASVMAAASTMMTTKNTRARWGIYTASIAVDALATAGLVLFGR